MRQPENLCAAYNSVVRNIGRRVKIKTNLGRNKVDITEGIIRETYPCVFLIELSQNEPSEPAEPVKTLSFTYTDVLTREVELVLC